jgi:polar amino acid transport system permease protein
MSWNWTFTWHILPKLLQGLAITVEATLAGTILALMIGLIWAGMLLSGRRILTLPARGIVELVRNTPLLIQLFFIYYVLPEVHIEMSALSTGIIALGVNYSAYTAEVYRAGLESIPRGQWNAAIALNLPRHRIWWDIILPQAVIPMIPALGNNLVAMFKDTPLLATITVGEMMQKALVIGDRTFRYLEPMTMVGVLFLVVSLMSSLGISRCEKLTARRR